MQNRKSIALLKTMDKKDRQQFTDFIQSPIINKDQRCTQLWQYLRPYAPDFASPKLNIETVAQTLYTHSNIQNPVRQLGVVMSLLTKLVERFFVFQMTQSKEQENYRQYLLLHSFRQKNLPKYFIQLAKKCQQQQPPLTQQNSKDFQHQHLLNSELLDFGKTYTNQKQFNISYTQLLTVFEQHSYLKQLSYWCGLLNEALTRPVAYEQTKLKHIIRQIEIQKLEQIPAIQYYFQLLLLLKERKEEQFFLVKALLTQNPLPLHRQEIQFFYTILSNYCNRKYIQGKVEYLREMFILYQQMLDQKLLHVHQYIPPKYVKNIVTLALRLKEWQWVADFMSTYQTAIHPNYQKSIYHYNYGQLHFYQQNYSEALTHLQDVDYIDAHYYCGCKSLLLKIYYELDEFIAFEALFEAFRMYLRRESSLTKKRKQAYKNFIVFARKLYKLQDQPNPKETAKLLVNIKQADAVSDRPWLLEKIQ